MGRENQNKRESDPTRSLIFGLKPVLELLRSRGPEVSRIEIASGRNEKSVADVLDLARKEGVLVKRVPAEVIEKKTGPGMNHQGVLAELSGAVYQEEAPVLRKLADTESSVCVVLDGVQDPHNLGAIIRTAECAGADAVFIPKRRAAGLTEIAMKSSAGAASRIPVVRVTNINRLIGDLKEAGFWIAGAAGESAVNYTSTDWKGKWAVVLGSEGEGLHKLTREKCDVLVSIPLYGKIGSLNVSVAAGILLFEAARQRN